ncbi:MAG: hypothetical protein ACR2N8_04450 [Parvibaculales bacterium]
MRYFLLSVLVFLVSVGGVLAADRGLIGDRYHAFRAGSAEWEGGSNVDMDGSVALYYAYGFRRTEQIRLEAEIGYSSLSGRAFTSFEAVTVYEDATAYTADDATTASVDETSPLLVETPGEAVVIGGHGSSRGVSTNRISFMVNGYKDFSTKYRGQLKFFVGGGIGYQMAEIEKESFTQIVDSSIDLATSYSNPGVKGDEDADAQTLVEGLPLVRTVESDIADSVAFNVQIGVSIGRVVVSYRYMADSDGERGSLISAGYRF